MNELNRLRAEAKRRHKAATAKAYRLRQQGVEITGSGYDPRTDVNKIDRYTKKQLTSYINKIDNFTDRKTKFVGGVEGKPISKNVFDAYKRAETAYNISVDKSMKRFADVEIPGLNMTVSQRAADLEARRFNVLRMEGESVVGGLSKYNRTPKRFSDEKAIKGLTKKLSERAKPKYSKYRTKTFRANARKMVSDIGDQDMLEQFDALTDEDFQMLWQYTPFNEGVRLNYMSLQSQNLNVGVQSVADAHLAESKELLQWALNRRR